MPLQPWMKLLSTDDHVIEHPKVWSDRLPAKYQDAGPRIIEKMHDANTPGISIGGLAVEQHFNDKPMQLWQYEGRQYPNIALNAVAGRAKSDYGVDPVRYDEMLPGCYDPVARLADMDVDGVWGALCFPSFARFACTVFLDGEDKELALLGVQAYNDFILDEWCPTAPDRYIPLVGLPLWDADLAIKEVQRTAAKGAKAIMFPEAPHNLGLPSFFTDHWDNFFSAVEETDMPLAMHFGSGGSAPQVTPGAPLATMITMFSTNSMATLTDLMFAPVFHRHPKLKVGLSEGGIGWIPYMLERADYVWERHRFYQNVDQTTRPSDLFRRHIHGCFISDEHGVRNRDTIGIDNITWESDYPHSDSNWPHSRKMAEEVFMDVPDDEVHKIAELNVRRLYNFPDTSAAK
ncbi:amidohydrolase family protein [Jatrophihabitans sp. DSM 45814]